MPDWQLLLAMVRELLLVLLRFLCQARLEVQGLRAILRRLHFVFQRQALFVGVPGENKRVCSKGIAFGVFKVRLVQDKARRGLLRLPPFWEICSFEKIHGKKNEAAFKAHFRKQRQVQRGLHKKLYCQHKRLVEALLLKAF